MIKAEREYLELYGDIPKNREKRLDYLLSSIKSRSVKGKLISNMLRIMNIKWKEISYTIWLVPKATPRPRTSFRNHFYVSGASDNRKLFNEFKKQNPDLPYIITPCEFYCTSYLPIPRSMPMAEQILAELEFIRPISKPDFDNLAKTYSDMTQGLLLYDDALIMKGVSEKFYSIKPRIEIRFRYMAEMDSKYNTQKINKSKMRKEI